MNKKLKITIIVIIVILVIMGGLVGGAYFYFHSLFSNMKVEPIDENNLDVNADLYDEVEGISESEFNNIINIVLFGSDSRDVNSAESGRSDTIMILSVNPKTKRIKLISIPRDTYVNVPGYGKTKINHAYAYGKEELSIKTINNNFGLNITEYATIDFSGLVNIINQMGGVQMTITPEEMTYINGALTWNISGNKEKLTTSGNVILNGEQALAHSRNRTLGNDFTRASRQRQVIEALINKIATRNVSEIMDLADDFLKEVKTNINVTSYIPALTNIVLNKDSYLKNMISVQVPSTDYASGKMIDGVYYFVSDMDRAKKDFITYIYEK